MSSILLVVVVVVGWGGGGGGDKVVIVRYNNNYVFVLHYFPLYTELKKVQTRGKLHPSRLGGGGLSATLGRTPYYGRGPAGGGSLNRGGSLKHSSFSMSHSGRF